MKLQAESNKNQWGHDYSAEAQKMKKGYRALKWAGRAVAVYNFADTEMKYRSGEINKSQRILEQGTNVITTFGGVYGAAWGVGWELGRWITTTETYQDWKYETFYPWYYGY